MASKKTSIEQSLSQLESLVNTMEEGDLSLEEALKQFEQGIKLARQCQKSLSEAEQKVDILIKENSHLKLEPFDPEEDED